MIPQGVDPFSAMSKHLQGSANSNEALTQGCPEFMIHCHPYLNILQYVNRDGSIKYLCKFCDKFTRPLLNAKDTKDKLSKDIAKESHDLHEEFTVSAVTSTVAPASTLAAPIGRFVVTGTFLNFVSALVSALEGPYVQSRLRLLAQ